MKKFVVILLLLVIVCSFVGCAEIVVERFHNKDSTVTDRVTVTIDESVLISYGYTLDDAKSLVISNFERNGYTVLESDKENVVIGEYLYSSRAEFIGKTGSDTSSQGEENKDFFFIYGESEGYTPFRRFIVDDEQDGLSDVERIMLSVFPGMDQSVLSDVTYVYKYGTPYESIKTNAEYVYENEQGLYVHEWRFSALEAEYGRISMSQTVPNTTGWYMVAILVGLAIVALGFGMVTLKEKKEKENEDG